MKLSIQPILVDVINNKTANAISWRFESFYILGSDATSKGVVVEFYSTNGEQSRLIFTTRVVIPASVLAVWLDDSVITNYILTQIPSIVLIP